MHPIASDTSHTYCTVNSTHRLMARHSKNMHNKYIGNKHNTPILHPRTRHIKHPSTQRYNSHPIIYTQNAHSRQYRNSTQHSVYS